MLLALGACALLALALSIELVSEPLRRALARERGPADPAQRSGAPAYDPGRELRAERRARALLRSCVNGEEWEMFRELGFIRVWGQPADGQPGAPPPAPAYAYLIYPHKPVVAYLLPSGAVIGEYCVSFPREPHEASGRLPDADDVLAKWMLLTGDERALLAAANVHLPGRQIDPERLRADLLRLERFERRRAERLSAAQRRRVPRAGSLQPQ